MTRATILLKTMAYIDYDPETQEQDIRKIVDLLHAGRVQGRSERVAAKARASIIGALNHYRAAIVALVFEGNLSVDQGAELEAIVRRIVQEQEQEQEDP